MPRICTICSHSERADIDVALVGGRSLRGLSALFRVSEDALARHRDGHLPAVLAQAQEAAEVIRADGLLDQVRSLQTRTLAILAKAEASGALGMGLAAIREARGNLELLAKLLGELQQEGTVNILISPEWVSLRTTILLALQPYPEARQAVARALEGS